MNAEAVFAHDVRGETEICYFELVLRVEEQVLGLEVSVNNFCFIVEVFNSWEQLEEVVACKLLVKTTLLVLDLDEGEEVALLDEFKDDEKDLDGFAGGFDNNFSFTIVLDELYYVGMVHLL